MKKILSVVLALVMLFAMCVPTFAADLPPISEDPLDVVNIFEAILDFILGIIGQIASLLFSFN